MEKAYDRVNRKKVFDVMRGYGVQENLMDVIERIYDGSVVKFKLEGIMTEWCNIDSGVRQGCPLSSLLFNIYVIELGMNVAHCKYGLKYLMVDRDGLIVEKSQAVFLYTEFGYKEGNSTTLGTLIYKEVIDHYIHNDRTAYSCLDVSKALDRVNCGKLLSILINS